ncbi:MAG: SpoIID/LytB domain-containing protein [Actinomycetota bacterium]
MARRSRHVLRLVAVLLLVSACTSEPPGGASPSATTESPTGATSATPSPSPSGGEETPVADAVRLRAPDGGSFLVRGTYPRVRSECVDPDRPSLTARYPGTLSVERADDGTLSLTVSLPFEKYLEGIAEVPSSWPRSALEAQAIAARSYALATTGWSGAEGETLSTPICATTACQVYQGIPVPFEPGVRRWYGAVRRTDGEVLLFEGRPADTVYFSTSDGQTYGNDEVFGSAPLPYLRPVVEEDDGASPVSRWSVRVPFDDLATFLHEAGEWPPARAISSVALDGSTVVVSGEGASRPVDLSTFREAVNAWAPCLEPGRYPPGSLPITIPSRWLTVSSEPGAAVFDGRGWGHGAGMVQWGAYGKAQRGLSASDILAYYYGGLRPEPYPEPGVIHVQVATGLTSLRIVPSAPGARLHGQELGPGPVSIVGGDRLTVTIEE